MKAAVITGGLSVRPVTIDPYKEGSAKMKNFGALFLSLVLALSLAVPAFAAEGTGYSDVDAGASYAEAVIYCREHELMDGVGDGRFDPEGNLTRAALATVLYRMEGEPSVTGEDSFTDTDSGVWYSNAILWASQRELMGGYGGGIFGTADLVTRQDMAAIFYRYANTPESSNGESYDDENAIAGYAAAAVDWASANGIVSALSGNTFAPKTSATRAQVAVALMNFDRIRQNTPTSSAVTNDLVAILREGAPLLSHIAVCDRLSTLTYGEQIGLGSRTFALTILDNLNLRN